jgi:hypothetical protein
MKIDIRSDKPIGKVKHYWTKCVGSCHAATALREDWRNEPNLDFFWAGTQQECFRPYQSARPIPYATIRQRPGPHA